MATKTLSGIYDNGTIQFHTTIKLGRKLPLRNRTRVRFMVEWPRRRGAVIESFGMIRVPKRLARLIAESPEFSVLDS